ncbi:MAG: putative lipid II flippase FtsW [Candidatus Dormibacteria bacterium]
MASSPRTLRRPSAPAAPRRPPARSRGRGTAPVDAFRRVARPVLRPAEGAGAMTQIDGWLLASIVGLVAFGLVMVYSASEALGYENFGNANYYFQRQLFWVAIGGVGMIVAARTDYHRWLGWSRPFALVSALLLVAVLVPHLGTQKFGARRWFTLGPASLQPSAVATLMSVVFLSKWVVDRAPGMRQWRLVRDFAVVLVALLGAVLLEKDLGSTLVIAAIGLTVLALGGARKRHLVLLLGMMGGLGYLAIMAASYRATRLHNFRNPFADPLGTGYQSVEALYALGSGGLSGVGLGHSIHKFQWLPEAHTDFIFAIIGEELGLIGTVALVGAFLLLAWRGISASMRAPDTYGALVAGGITAWISVQAFINIGAVTNVIPTTGIPLPFISYGGTALAMTLVGVGILCNVSAQGRQQGVSRRAHVDRWRGDGRSPHPGAGRRGGVARR